MSGTALCDCAGRSPSGYLQSLASLAAAADRSYSYRCRNAKSSAAAPPEVTTASALSAIYRKANASMLCVPTGSVSA